MMDATKTRPFTLQLGGHLRGSVLHEELTNQDVISLTDMTCRTVVSTRLQLREIATGLVEVPSHQQTQVEDDDANGDDGDLFIVHRLMAFRAFNKKRRL